jgi:hypothetical protein
MTASSPDSSDAHDDEEKMLQKAAALANLPKGNERKGREGFLL